MSRSGLYAVIAILAIGLAGIVGYVVYQQSQQPSLEIRVDETGIRVDGNG